MDAVPVISQKRQIGHFIVELVVWRVPTPVPGSDHFYKYRLFFGRRGHRIIGYDNERGKGDHRHVEGVQVRYRFTDLETLIADFTADTEQWRALHASVDSQD